MSLLSDVIEISEEVNINTVDENLPQLWEHVKNIKQEFEDYIQSVYYEYTRKIHENNYLMKKVDNVINKLIEYKRNIENVQLHDTKSCAKDVANQHENLQVLHIQIEQIQQLLNMFHMNEEVLSLINKKKYTAAILKSKDIIEIIKSIPKEEQLRAIKKLNMKVSEHLLLLDSELVSIFNKNVMYKVDDKGIDVKIQPYNVEMEEICFVLYTNSNYQMASINKLLHFIYEDIYKTIIKNSVKVTILTESNLYNLNVEIIDNKVPNFEKVFTAILKVTNFFNIYLTYKLNHEDFTLMNYIGDNLAEDVSKLIISDCLEHTIPMSIEELKNYKEICEDIAAFEIQMTKYDMPIKLDKFVEDIDNLFIKKKCESYLKKALDLMKKDLHDYSDVGTPYNPDNIFQSVTFYRCTVSKSTDELLSLIEEMLKLSNILNDNNAIIIQTIEQICFSYTHVVPEHHKKLLQTIPQQVALFYNNCQYLAYKLYNLQEKHNNTDVDFAKSIFNLQTIGKDMFNNCVEQNKEQNNTIMNECGLIGVETLEKVDPKMEKCIRQCLRQQELLKTVWQKVLSHTDYNKAIGYILNDLCKFLITRIIKFVDISSVASEQLVELIKMIQTRSLRLFTDPKEINLYVEMWHKFKELEFVLNSNLHGINDRWADGKGPLALQFQPAEMRNLICALFQNTDIRASVLSIIK